MLKKTFTQMYKVFNEMIQNRNIFLLAIFVAISGFSISYLYYSGKISYDRFSWIFWIASLILLFIAINKRSESTQQDRRTIMLLVLGITAVYFLTHLWNYNVAPWNSNGLFDDGAWDIYFTQEFTSNPSSILLIFNDTQIGRIGRELVFHQYIGIWFKLFGYNLFIFNMSLVFLGYMTVLFTGLLALKIFKNKIFAVIAAALINFYPLHFTQIFMGHRYAICAPLMMISLYFLYDGLQQKSMKKLFIGGVFTALCMQSAIMGKQYIYALIGTICLYLLFQYKKSSETRRYLPYIAVSLLAFLFTLAPLIAYLQINKEMYSMRESSLINEFIARITTEGITPLWDNMKLCYNTIFAGNSNQRQFMNIYPIIPMLYLPLVIVGIVVSFLKKHYYIALMIVIPLAANFVTTSYDFRLLISAPFYILAIVFALNELITIFNKPWIQKSVAFALTIGLLISPVRYLYALSSNPNGQYLLPHTSVAASRFIQDVVVGDTNPNFLLNPDEFKRENKNYSYDTLAATRESYAHVHAFLHDYDAFKILALLNNFPYRGKNPVELKNSFAQSVKNYKVTNKDLMLILENGSEIAEIINVLDQYTKKEKLSYQATIDGIMLEMLTIRISYEDIPDFKEFIEKKLKSSSN